MCAYSTTGSEAPPALTWCGILLAKSKSEKNAAPPSPAAGEELRNAARTQKRKRRGHRGLAAFF